MASPEHVEPTGRAWPTSLGTLSLGSPFGIPVSLSVGGLLLVVVVVAVTMESVVRYVVPGAGPATGALVGVAAGVLLELSVLVHEISHCIVARMLGLRVLGLRLQLVAGVTEIEGDLADPRTEYLVAIAGPFATISLACLGGVGYCLSGITSPHLDAYSFSGSAADVLVVSFTLSNVALALFNLLPGMPLDGGRVLRAAVWGATGRSHLGTATAARVGQAVALATGVLGFHQVFSGRGTLQGLFVVAAGLYVGAGASLGLRQARLERVSPHLDARTLCRPAVLLPPDLSVAEALARAAVAGARAAVVVDGRGRPLLVADGARLDAVAAPARPTTPLATVCTAVEPGVALDVTLLGPLLVEAMQAHPASEYVLVERSPAGRTTVAGVLVSLDVANAVSPARYRPTGAWLKRAGREEDGHDEQPHGGGLPSRPVQDR